MERHGYGPARLVELDESIVQNDGMSYAWISAHPFDQMIGGGRRMEGQIGEYLEDHPIEQPMLGARGRLIGSGCGEEGVDEAMVGERAFNLFNMKNDINK